MVELTDTHTKETIGNIGDYNLVRELGIGYSAKVMLARKQGSSQNYALKIFKLDESADINNQNLRLLRQEVKVIANSNHKHIVKYFEHQESATMTLNDGTESRVAYIAEEAVLGGSLFDFVKHSGVFDENVCRYYFK